MKKLFGNLLCIAIITLTSVTAKASHLYGADLFYTHVSNNTYKITFVAYGDCSGSSFNALSGSTPNIEIYNGTTLVTTILLSVQSPSTGIEVTPVCSAQLNNTTCVSTTGTIPGVKKFTYSANYNLGTTSANWLFRFNGEMGANSLAGRSNSITNIAFPTGGGGSVMVLEATLNNTSTVGPNSSPVYTSIPTPFFCINIPANNNQGAVDANGDGLVFSLVPGLQSVNTSTVPIPVVYNTGYTATAPLAVATSTLSFSSTTGQLAFTPNLVQRSLVVNKVEEYRNNVLVGTSMREMTFVVLSNCANNPPGGNLTNITGGTLISNTVINACQAQGNLTFNINPTDLDNDNINVTTAGVPAGATFTITNNNTSSPTGAFSWGVNNVTPGAYTFYVTYTDNGCALSSKQTQAYTINILPTPKIAFSLVSAATCTKKAVFNVTPSNTPTPWTITVLQGTTTVQTFTNIAGTLLDSLNPGSYTIRVAASNLCLKDTVVTFAPPPAITPLVSMVRPTCIGSSNGSITILANGGKPTFQYAIGSGTFGAGNVFTNMAAGTYVLHIKDANNCLKDTTVQLLDPLSIVANIAQSKPICNYYNNGKLTVNAINGTTPYQYALNAGSFSTTNTFTGLYAGTYTIHIKDANNCLKDSVFVLADSINIHAPATLTHILCNGDATGVITLSGNSGTAPYGYKLGAGTFMPSNTFTGMTAGTYNFRIEDADHCYLDTAITLNQPAKLYAPSVVTDVTCFGLTNGSIVTNPVGGVTPYSFAINTSIFGAGNAFSNLAPATYTIRVKDNNNCIRDTLIQINQPAVLAITGIVKTDPKCFGAADGTATITVTGGNIPYTYAADANPFSTNNILTGLIVGSHTLHVVDNKGCIRDSIITLSQPTAITPTAQVKKSTCSTLGDGKVTLSATGGTPPYSYALGSGSYSTSPVFSPLPAGFHLFHIKDSKDCIKDTIINITDSLYIFGTANVTNAACFGQNSGIITVTPGGGASPYTFAQGALGAYSSNNTFSSLVSATYLIRIKDANGCVRDTNIFVDQPTKLDASMVTTDVSCFAYNDGKIVVNAFGGTPAYTFSVNGGPFAAGSSVLNLYKGTYIVQVKDSKSCLFADTVTLNEPAPVVFASLNKTDVLCFGDSSGQVTINATGGTAPYNYRWNFNPVQTSNILAGIFKGQHTIRVLDAKGCFRDTVLEFTQPDRLAITGVTITSPTCEGYVDGEIVVSATGGVIPYQYAVNNQAYVGGTGVRNLAEGAYVLHVKDNNGCIRDTSLTLKGYPHIVFNAITPKNISCFGVTDGTISINVGGGVPSLTYGINAQQAFVGNMVSGLAAGTYKITITDSKDCKKDTTLTLSQPEKISVTLNAKPNDCDGSDDGGIITTKVTGGVEPYSYLWSDRTNSNKPELTGAANGNYRVVVRDENECSDSAIATIVYDNCCKVFIPDAFTPNNDGKNDQLHVLYKGDLKIETFRIFNRFGQIVFTGNDATVGWDGTFNGIPQDLGTFNYYLKGICGNGGREVVEYKGTITLIR